MRGSVLRSLLGSWLGFWRQGLLLACVLGALVVVVLAATPAHSASRPGRVSWVTAWAAAPQPPVAHSRVFRHQTVRQIVLPTIGGSQVRLGLSNVYGSRPLTIGAASIAGVPVSFGGVGSVRIPPGAVVLSDPLRLAVRAAAPLAISLSLPNRTAARTDVVTSLDVGIAGRRSAAVVALGDSITEGVLAGGRVGRGWPFDLGLRLRGRYAVLDEGIGGNRLLNDARCCGANAVARFQRDVAAHSGVRAVILLEGVNDIGFSQHRSRATAPHSSVSAAQIIAGYQMIIALAHADGLKVFGATLTPFKGARYWTPAGELKRETVNAWILGGHAFDGVIDFATVLADPSDPQMLNPVYDSGDHLHPDAAGYRRMADTVDLSTLIRAIR
ncbi:MAG: SGNH/GDSL hydrolase family protein [Solirubrobacteraceae bacterium]